MTSLRRLLFAAIALAILAWVGSWLFARQTVRFDLGPGEALVARDGVDAFAVREAAGAWRLYDAAARRRDEGLPLPLGAVDPPCLAADGSAWLLDDTGLSRTAPRAAGGETTRVAPAALLPPGTRLRGLSGETVPVLDAPGDDEARRLLLLLGAAPPAGDTALQLLPLQDAQGPARLPAGASDADLACSPFGPALALRTPRGWEAWTFEPTGAARRLLAEGCAAPGAVFTPDGRALILPGRVSGLWTLSLADGRMSQMAEGNLGLSRRVPYGFAFRGRGEHVRLVAPQWSLDGWLQLCQTHLFGGGRSFVGISFTHHYAVTVSADGRFMAYAQAHFDEAGDAPFEEDLYVVDFDQAVSTVKVATRHGGLPLQGPHFVGRGAALVFLAEGQVQRVELQAPDAGEEDA